MSKQTYLYIYENRIKKSLYIGIGESMGRVWEDHNEDALRLRGEEGTQILQTIEPFSNRKDALKAEAITIYVARMAGVTVRRISTDENGEDRMDTLPPSEELIVTNRSGSTVLGPAVFKRPGEVPYLALSSTAIVTIKPDEIDDRPALHAGLPVARFAERASQYWRLGTANKKQYPVTRVMAVLKNASIILGEWDLDPSEPFLGPYDEKFWRFNFINPENDDPRDTKGKVLTFDGRKKTQQGHIYSSDVLKSILRL